MFQEPKSEISSTNVTEGSERVVEDGQVVKQELTNKERSNWKMFRGIFKGEFSTGHYFNLKKKEEFCQGSDSIR